MFIPRSLVYLLEGGGGTHNTHARNMVMKLTSLEKTFMKDPRAEIE